MENKTQRSGYENLHVIHVTAMSKSIQLFLKLDIPTWNKLQADTVTSFCFQVSPKLTTSRHVQIHAYRHSETFCSSPVQIAEYIILF